MLVISRCVGEETVIAGNIRVKVLGIKGGRIRLGISAPDHVRVDRAEIHARLAEFLPDESVEQLSVVGS